MEIYNFNGKKIKVTKQEREWMEKMGVGTTQRRQKEYAYISPMSGKLITDRKQRAEEMKKYNVREVDPREARETLRDRGFDERRN